MPKCVQPLLDYCRLQHPPPVGWTFNTYGDSENAGRVDDLPSFVTRPRLGSTPRLRRPSSTGPSSARAAQCPWRCDRIGPPIYKSCKGALFFLLQKKGFTPGGGNF